MNTKLLLPILALLLAGCVTTRVSKGFFLDEDFRKTYVAQHQGLPDDIRQAVLKGYIIPGMDKNTVMELLGMPAKRYISETDWMEIWFYPHISVGFNSNRIVIKVVDELSLQRLPKPEKVKKAPPGPAPVQPEAPPEEVKPVERPKPAPPPPRPKDMPAIPIEIAEETAKDLENVLSGVPRVQEEGVAAILNRGKGGMEAVSLLLTSVNKRMPPPYQDTAHGLCYLVSALIAPRRGEAAREAIVVIEEPAIQFLTSLSME